MKLSTNEVTLIGFVGGDAQAKETKNHNKYAVVSLATTDSWKDKDGAWQKRRSAALGTVWWAGRRLATRWSAI